MDLMGLVAGWTDNEILLASRTVHQLLVVLLEFVAKGLKTRDRLLSCLHLHLLFGHLLHLLLKLFELSKILTILQLRQPFAQNMLNVDRCCLFCPELVSLLPLGKWRGYSLHICEF